MKSKILLLFVAFFIIACKQELKTTSNATEIISKNVRMIETSTQLELQSGKFTYNFDKKKFPFQKIVILNASIIGYITALEAEETIIGVSSPEYIFSDKIKNLIKSGKIQDIGNEQKYDVERIIALKPDAVFTNYIANFENVYDVLKTNGIHVIFLDEFKEQNPLDKSAYLKVFGKLLGKDEQANKLYLEIVENYNNIQKLVSNEAQKPKAIANEMYGNIWYMPGGNTATAKFISAAGGDYIEKNNQEDKAINMSFEEVFAISKNAQIWVNAGNHASKKDMLLANSNYSKLEVFQKGKIYAITGKQKDKTNDYFESGVVRADWVLQDYVRIFYPHLLPKHDLIYMKEIK